ncbi:MAG TPA: YbgC/FadM family acyl-CoA thioesterase [Acetobacteraceae bacterium]|nr:YbgC/FadM family acyl-CoA thioesterase [Acetobacteraceae bacterium]
MITHSHQVRVYYEDTDAGGVAYHAAYLRFAERARTEALRAAGLPHAAMLAEHGVMFMVRRVELEYLRPARLDDLLTIRTESVSATGATVTLRQEFFPEGMALGAPIVVARVLLVCVKAEGVKAAGTAARIPPRWRAALAA